MLLYLWIPAVWVSCAGMILPCTVTIQPSAIPARIRRYICKIFSQKVLTNGKNRHTITVQQIKERNFYETFHFMCIPHGVSVFPERFFYQLFISDRHSAGIRNPIYYKKVKDGGAPESVCHVRMPEPSDTEVWS